MHVLSHTPITLELPHKFAHITLYLDWIVYLYVFLFWFGGQDCSGHFTREFRHVCAIVKVLPLAKLFPRIDQSTSNKRKQWDPPTQQPNRKATTRIRRLSSFHLSRQNSKSEFNNPPIKPSTPSNTHHIRTPPRRKTAMTRFAAVALLLLLASSLSVDSREIPDDLIRLPSESSRFFRPHGDDDSEGTRWAVLIAGSNGYWNYRHQVNRLRTFVLRYDDS